MKQATFQYKTVFITTDLDNDDIIKTDKIGSAYFEIIDVVSAIWPFLRS